MDATTWMPSNGWQTMDARTRMSFFDPLRCAGNGFVARRCRTNTFPLTKNAEAWDLPSYNHSICLYLQLCLIFKY